MPDGTLMLLAAGFVLLIAGAELLVRGASRLAVLIGISPLVVGLTVVAFGTGSPELAVSMRSAWTGRADIAVGNVVGSNILNVLLVLGIAALIAPLRVSRQLVRLDVPLMIAVSVVFYLFAADGNIGRVEGLLLFFGIVVYSVFAIRKSRRETSQASARGDPALSESKPRHALGRSLGYGALLLSGFGLVVLGAEWMVEGAAAVARVLGVSELVIGLTIVAVGTSLPEIAATVVAGLRGERDMAVGNVIGSNLFNILAVIGASSLVSPAGLPVPAAALRVDIPIMLAAAVACLPIFLRGHRIDRWEGGLFLGYYFAYTIYLFLYATAHDALPAFSGLMLGFVMPLTVVTIGILLWRTHVGSGRQQ
jgi:cation:H+ antiporter